MADYNRRTRQLNSPPQASRMFQSSLRPSGFLNMLNPMSGRNYQGYMQANQSVLEEDEDEQEGELDDASSPFKSNRDRSSTWGESSRMTTFNTGKPKAQAMKDESSDDEVPQSMMIEASPHVRRLSSARQSKGKGKAARHAPRTSASGPILPVTNDDLKLPPRPSEVDTPATEEAHAQTSSQKRNIGLDAYERALWNWVNVYDLDVFLQDVYRYYEGNGIVSIALARGLHLL